MYQVNQIIHFMFGFKEVVSPFSRTFIKQRLIRERDKSTAMPHLLRKANLRDFVELSGVNYLGSVVAKLLVR